MVSQKYRGSCIGAALAKWLAKNTVASQKMALEEKMEDGALEMLLGFHKSVKPGKNSIFLNKGKTEISVENHKFSRFRMTKRTLPLESSREI